MAELVKFLKGLSTDYQALSGTGYDENTFYFTTDDYVLYLGEHRIGADPNLAITVQQLQQAVNTLNGSDSDTGSVKKQIKDAIEALKSDVIGSLDELSTTVKDKVVTAINSLKEELDTTNGNVTSLTGKIGDVDSLDTTAKVVVEAINELNTKVGQFASSEAVTVSAKETPDGDASKTYEIKQGGVSVGTIDIPKDKFLQKAELKTLEEPDGKSHEAGTYIVLTIANEAEGSSELWIDVKTLVDTYEGDNKSSNVTITVAEHKIKANIDAGKVTSTELAADAVITAKIADANVTKEKLANGVTASLDKADSALQSKDIIEGSTDGTISVSGSDVKVHNLDAMIQAAALTWGTFSAD